MAEKGWLATMLTRQPWQWLGTISYSLYLVHTFALGALRPLAGKLPPDLGRIAFATLGPIAAVAVSYVAYRLIEVRLTDALFKPKPKTETVNSAM
ncbi:acyltransferase [bacterium]|nr:MAG: acyltransferase [bacterium]